MLSELVTTRRFVNIKSYINIYIRHLCIKKCKSILAHHVTYFGHSIFPTMRISRLQAVDGDHLPFDVFQCNTFTFMKCEFYTLVHTYRLHTLHIYICEMTFLDKLFPSILKFELRPRNCYTFII